MTRQSPQGKTKIPGPREAKAALKEAGITQLQAAPELGVTFEHLNRVLNGHRESRRLLRDVMALADQRRVSA